VASPHAYPFGVETCLYRKTAGSMHAICWCIGRSTSSRCSVTQAIGASLPCRAAHRPPRIATGVIGRRPMLSWTPAWLYAFLHIDADFGASSSTTIVAPCREQGPFLPSLVAAFDGSLRGKEQTYGAMFTEKCTSKANTAMRNPHFAAMGVDLGGAPDDLAGTEGACDGRICIAMYRFTNTRYHSAPI